MRPLDPGIRFAGLAHPMAYEPADRPLEAMSYGDFSRRQYAEGPEGLWREAGPWGAPDEVLVIDAGGAAAGILGSANTLDGRAKGSVGSVIDGACRAVRAGDLVVADDDGVIVVPSEIADEVVDRARRIQDADRPARRDGYRKLGLPSDETLG